MTDAPKRDRPRDTFDVGEAYEPYVGRWSRLVAREFLTWLAVPPGRRWLDVGCGTGALSGTILALAEPASVVGVDPSPSFVAYAQAQVRDPFATFMVGDARDLPVDDADVDVVVSGLVLNFVPAAEHTTAIAEMRRVARPGGTVAAYVWDYAGEMQLMRHFWDSAAELDPLAAELDEGRRFSICNPDALMALFRDGGLDAIEVRAIEIAIVFRDFDDYWLPFLGGQGSAPSYVGTLDAERRDALRDRIRSRLPIATDGSISLIARAWAARGAAPS